MSNPTPTLHGWAWSKDKMSIVEVRGEEVHRGPRHRFHVKAVSCTTTWFTPRVFATPYDAWTALAEHHSAAVGRASDALAKAKRAYAAVMSAAPTLTPKRLLFAGGYDYSTCGWDGDYLRLATAKEARRYDAEVRRVGERAAFIEVDGARCYVA